MIWVSTLLALVAVGVILYWLFVLTEGVYLGSKVVIALYDWNASRYDQVKGVLPHEDGIHLARPLLVAMQGIQSPLVLDIATGTGRLPLALLRQWDFRGRIVGLDLSRRMLAIAKRRMYAYCHCVGWIRDDAMSLPFPDNVFYAVTCIEALEFLPNPWEALAEMVRVLRPGGQLMVTNRVGTDAFFFPKRACSPALLEQRLQGLGLDCVRMRRWQVHYDLVDAQKPLEQSERKP